jgi:hypothetical protein
MTETERMREEADKWHNLLIQNEQAIGGLELAKMPVDIARLVVHLKRVASDAAYYIQEQAALAQAVPQGYVVVPIEPTQTMMLAFINRMYEMSMKEHSDDLDKATHGYRAMIAAAPKAYEDALTRKDGVVMPNANGDLEEML